MNWLAHIRPASIWRPVSQPDSSDCRPYSPYATVLPRWATPRIRPRCDLRNFMRDGIKAMANNLISDFQFPISNFRNWKSRNRQLAMSLQPSPATTRLLALLERHHF